MIDIVIKGPMLKPKNRTNTNARDVQIEIGQIFFFLGLRGFKNDKKEHEMMVN